MSILDREEIFNIGRRLRDERIRLGLSQEAFGTKVGTTGRTIKKYEGNETSPRANELLVAWRFGLDVLYVITGERAPLSLREERADYAPAEKLAEEIREMTLSESDARLLGDVARRFVGGGGKQTPVTQDETSDAAVANSMITEHDLTDTGAVNVKTDANK